MKKEYWGGAFTGVLVACALVTTGLAAHQFLSKRDSGGQQPEYVASWKSLIPNSVRLGRAEAPVKVIVFSDYECPYCARFQAIAKSVLSRRSKDFALYVQDFPLPGHRFALPAARAANCALAQGKFEQMHDLLLSRQGEFGRVSWASFAQMAQIPDPALFDRCVGETEVPARIKAGEQIAQKLGFRGTPTVIINGWSVNLSSEADLDRLITRARQGVPLS